VAASESYPEELLYHSEHDWARIDGDEAVLGVTWYAQDSLGELVHFEPPDLGSHVAKDASYGEVESVKAVSDLISPLSGEVLEVNAQVVAANTAKVLKDGDVISFGGVQFVYYTSARMFEVLSGTA